MTNRSSAVNLIALDMDNMNLRRDLKGSSLPSLASGRPGAATSALRGENAVGLRWCSG